MSGLGDSFIRGLSFAGASEADPVAWAKERGEHLWSRQADIARSVAANRYTAVPSAHGVGKSHTAALLALWWTATHPPAETFVVTTAPTANQVNAILWRYIARLHAKHGLPGQVMGWKSLSTNPTLVIGDNLVGSGRKPADAADKEQAMQAFQGIHARYLLVLLDEATGVPAWLWDAADTLMTARESRMLAIGNPDSPTSRFAEVCKPESGWTVLPISVFDSPAFTDEEVPPELLGVLPDHKWVEEREQAWGRESSLFTSKVLGRFPEEDENTLIPLRLIREAIDRDLTEEDEFFGPGTLGVDVGGDGPASDETTIYRVRGPQIRREWSSRSHDTMATTGQVLDRLVPGSEVVVDSIGIGRGVFDRLREQGAPVTAFVAGGVPRDRRQFANLRAEAWWNARERFMRGTVDLDPEDEALAAQLAEVRYFVNLQTGRTQIESKESMRKRGVASPDRADAVVMALWREHWEHVTPAQREAMEAERELERRLAVAEVIARADASPWPLTKEQRRALRRGTGGGGVPLTAGVQDWVL